MSTGRSDKLEPPANAALPANVGLPEQPGGCRRRLLLIRHPPVDVRMRGVCYGRSDVALSPEGRKQSFALAQRLARLPVERIVHSGLRRTACLATHLARLTGLTPERQESLAERDFGSWELQTWDAIYHRCGDEMMKMITEPDHFRPGGGETTGELAARVWSWYRETQHSGLTVAVSHGGPIAACLGLQRKLPVSGWMGLVPPCGTLVWTAPEPLSTGSQIECIS